MDGIFSVDVEPDLRTGGYLGITKGLPVLLKLLDSYSIKATFFVTGMVLESYPKVFVSILEKGHEIAIHGYSHRRYDLMDEKEKEEDLEKAIKIYQRLFDKLPKGFRAPQHSIDNETVNLLEKEHFKYDSSKTPMNIMLFRHIIKRNVNLRNIIRNFASEIIPYKIGRAMTEIPRTAFLISVGGFELKIYPAFFYKLIISMCRIFKIPFVFVMHSWDLIDTLDSRTCRLCPQNLFRKKLRSFLKYSYKKVSYIKMEEIYEKTRTKNS